MMWMLLLFAADPTGLRAALESADSVEVYYRPVQRSLTIRGDDLKELAKLVEIKGEVKNARGTPAAADHFVMTVRKGDSSAKYVLIEDRGLFFGGTKVGEIKVAELSDDRLGRALRKRFDVPEPQLKPEAPPKPKPPAPKTFEVEEIDKLGVDVAVVGDFVIVAEERLTVFKRADRKMTLVESVSHPLVDKFTSPRLATRDDRVYVASGLWIFVYELSDGKLKLLQRQDGLKSPNALAFFGDHLYVILLGNRLDVFAVAQDGVLTYVETVTHERMKYATGVAATRRAVYVVCHDRTLLTFQRGTDGKLTFSAADVDKLVNGSIRPVDRGLMFSSAVVAVEDRLYVLALRGSVSLWKTDGEQPVFVKRWGTDTDYARCSDMVITKDQLWVAAQGSLVYFLVGNDGQLSGPEKITALGATAVTASDEIVYATGEKLWVIEKRK